MLSWIRLCPRWTQPFEFCPNRAQLFHRRELADQVAAVLVRRKVVHRLVLQPRPLLELRAVILVLRAVRAQYQRQLALDVYKRQLYIEKMQEFLHAAQGGLSN